MEKTNKGFKQPPEIEAEKILANSRCKLIMAPENVMEWEILDTSIYAEGFNDWIVADRHLPNGIRQHVIKGKVPEVRVWHNAEIFGSDTLSSVKSSYQEGSV